jgi:hypothetical protein
MAWVNSGTCLNSPIFPQRALQAVGSWAYAELSTGREEELCAHDRADAAQCRGPHVT